MVEHIRRARRPLVVSHRDPDPDSLGTALALTELFEQLGAQPIAAMNAPQGVERPLSELPGFERVVPLTLELASGGAGGDAVDAVFAVDTATTELLGVDDAVIERLFRGRPVVNIDHHASNRRYGQVNYVDPAAAAAAEALWLILTEARMPITATMAVNLQAGLVADTLGFQIPDTTARTLRAAAALVDRGGETGDLPRRTLNARTLIGTRLFGAALAAAEASEDGRIIWTSVTNELASAVGSKVRDAFSVANSLQNVVGAEATAIFYESAGNRTRVSLRSTTRPIKAVAEHFGGGGHEMAAGCTIDQPIAVAREQVLERLRAELDR